MQLPTFVGTALAIAGGVAALAEPVPAMTTSSHSYPRPSGEPGIVFSHTRFTPGLGGAGAGFTAFGGEGYIAGTALGGPNGPNNANGKIGGAIGPGNLDLHGAIGPNGEVGCAAFGVGSNGFTTCLSARNAAPTPPPALEERNPHGGGCIGINIGGKGFTSCLTVPAAPTPAAAVEKRAAVEERAPQGGKGCLKLGVNGKGFTTCLSARDAAPTPPSAVEERAPQKGKGCIAIGANGKGFTTCLSAGKAAPS